MWNGFVKMARDKKSQAKEDNIVSALIVPTLGNLKLAEGIGIKKRLTPDGKQCLDLAKSKGITGFKKRLAFQIIKVDERNVNLLSYLQENHYSPETGITKEKLSDELFNLGVPNAKKITPIQGWLSFFKHVDLVDKKSSKYYLIKSQLSVIKKGEKKPSKSSFANVLKECKKELRNLTKGSPYLPIPEIRKFVCEKLQISTFTFNDMIVKFPSNYQGVRLVYATPMRRKLGGLSIGKKYYYFIGVFS